MSLLLANNSGGSSQKEYVDSLFSTYLYTGNGSTQTINNGIDLAGKGGLVWIKGRTGGANAGATNHVLNDTVRGAGNQLVTNSVAVAVAGATFNSFNSNGFTVGSGTNYNDGTGGDANFVSWTFRKAPKFFDVVTWTGVGGTAGRTISHSLGIAPGLIIVKKTNGAEDWYVYHRSLGNTGAKQYFCILNSTAAQDTGGNGVELASGWSDTSFDLVAGSSALNGSGDTYVAYLFAHDPSADGIIQCGSFTTDVSGNATVNLGWEPQFTILKSSNSVGHWISIDTMRAFSLTSAYSLSPNISNAESTGFADTTYRFNPTATGFQSTGALSANTTYIYLAVRRPNKPPTSGTQVYNAIARSGTYATANVTGVGFPPDLVIPQGRNGINNRAWLFDRLRGANIAISTNLTNGDITRTDELMSFNMDGATLGADAGGDVNASGFNYINWFFRRAPGFFSSFAYTGTGANRTTPHDLEATPDLLIVKSRSAATDWQVWCNGLAANEKLVLNSTAGKVTDATAWNSTLPTSTNISLGTASATNANTAAFIAYAFSNLPGIQKIGTYVGDGTSGRVIDCGFSTGARFVCIKAISTTGSWLVSDTARGIVSGNDPYLQLNSTAAEVTTEDWLDQAASGFIVNNVSSSNANTNGVTYMFWAIS